MILICSLIIIIIVHELGHLWAAKFCKCGVKVFSVGFGKVLWSKKIGKTVYQIAAFPMGGFCQLQGELEYSRSKYAFTNKTYSQKLLIIFAGVLMNIFTGLLAYGLFHFTLNKTFLLFAYYSVFMGLSNALPFIPCLDGSYAIIFLFEKRWGKKKTYRVWGKICSTTFKWLMILNLLSLPYLGYLIYTGKIL
jgi:membrane-associated protease RseP (regulator of RpoE activity)